MTLSHGPDPRAAAIGGPAATLAAIADRRPLRSTINAQTWDFR